MTPPFAQELADSVLQRFKEAPPSGYVLLANVRALDPADSFKISDDMTIRRATPVEVAELRAAIEFYYPQQHRNPYETKIAIRAKQDYGESYNVVAMPPEEWRYTVVEHLGGDARVHAFAEASLLTPWPIDLGFSAGNGAGAVGFGAMRGLENIVIEPEPDDLFLVLSRSQLEVLKRTFEKFTAFTHAPLDLRKPVRQLRGLVELQRNSSLKFLGMFAILESLISHAPKPSDPSDSITRQVTKKMALLGRRFEFPLPYVQYFGAANNDTVWKKLYAARSAIAHGSEPSFATDLAVLRDIEHAATFLRLATSAVLLSALEEPILVADLREC